MSIPKKLKRINVKFDAVALASATSALVVTDDRASDNAEHGGGGGSDGNATTATVAADDASPPQSPSSSSSTSTSSSSRQQHQKRGSRRRGGKMKKKLKHKAKLKTKTKTKQKKNGDHHGSSKRAVVVATASTDDEDAAAADDERLRDPHWLRHRIAVTTDVDEILLYTRHADAAIRCAALHQLCPCQLRGQVIDAFWTRILAMATDDSLAVRKMVLHLLCDGSPPALETEVIACIQTHFSRERDRDTRRMANRVLSHYRRTGEWNIM